MYVRRREDQPAVLHRHAAEVAAPKEEVRAEPPEVPINPGALRVQDELARRGALEAREAAVIGAPGKLNLDDPKYAGVKKVFEDRTTDRARLTGIRTALADRGGGPVVDWAKTGQEMGKISGEGVRAMLADFIDDGVEKLRARGLEPPCKFSCIVFGSTARDDGGAYPDLDYAFLVDKFDARATQYFELLSQHVGDRIHMLGEATVGEKYGMHACYGGAAPFFRNFGWRFQDPSLRTGLERQIRKLERSISAEVMEHGSSSQKRKLAAIDEKITKTKEKIAALKTKEAPEEPQPGYSNRVQVPKVDEELGRAKSELAALRLEKRDTLERFALIVARKPGRKALAGQLAEWREKRREVREDDLVSTRLHSMYSHVGQARTRGSATLITTPNTLAALAGPEKSDLVDKLAKRTAKKQETNPESRSYKRQVANAGDYCDFVDVHGGPSPLVDKLTALRAQIMTGPAEKPDEYHSRAHELFATVVVENAKAAKTDLEFGDEPFDMKKDFWRFPQTVVAFLAQIHGIKAMNNFERIDQLEAKGVFSKQFAAELRESYGFLVAMRAKCHSHYRCEEHSAFVSPEHLEKHREVHGDGVDPEALPRIRGAFEQLRALNERLVSALADQPSRMEAAELRSIERQVGALNDSLALIEGIDVLSARVENTTDLTALAFKLRSTRAQLFKAQEKENDALVLANGLVLDPGERAALEKTAAFLARLKDHTLAYAEELGPKFA